MGLLFADVVHLLGYRIGKAGGNAVTLGRQNVFLHRSEIKRLWNLIGNTAAGRRWCDSYHWGQYADSFFVDVLNVDSAQSIDFCAYEGAASIVHDLGKPLPQKLYGKFDLVVDIGTLEHIFHVTVALENLMRLVRVGGLVHPEQQQQPVRPRFLSVQPGADVSRLQRREWLQGYRKAGGSALHRRRVGRISSGL
jgi:hypothetical protein